MPACLECGIGAAQPIMIHDLTPGSLEVAAEPYCASCLRERGVFCERHNTRHIWAGRAPTAAAGEPKLMSACPVCALETALRLPRRECWDIAIALKPNGDVETFLEMARSLGIEWMPLLAGLDQLVCAVAITAAWHGLLLDDFVKKLTE